MTVHDERYNEDIARAEGDAQLMRRGNHLGRVLWGVVEGLTTELGMLDEVVTTTRELRDRPAVAVDLAPLEQRLDAIEATQHGHAHSVDELAAKLDALSAALSELAAVVLAEARRVTALSDGLFQALAEQRETLQRLLEFTQLGEAGPATHGRIFLDGKASIRTGEFTMTVTIKDNDAAKTASVAWSDVKGAPADGVTDAWSGDNDAAATVVDNGDGTATVTPGLPGTVNLKVVGTNADGTTVELTDVLVVEPSDAVSGTIALN